MSTVERGGAGNRLVVVANRLPIEPDGAGGWRRSVGGMVTALAPAVRSRRGAWVGWNQTEHPVPASHAGVRLRPVALPAATANAYYNGYANSTIWPDYHDCLEPPVNRARWWEAYVQVNHVFASEAARAVAPGGTAWVHDYHLQLLPALLRAHRDDIRIGFFLHIPVPTLDSMRRIPQRETLLRGVLGADAIGTQRPADAVAFLSLARAILGLHVEDGAVHHEGRRIEVRGFPSSVDIATIEALAAGAVTSGAVDAIRAGLGDPATLILGVERLDYTKGVEQRLAAYRALLGSGRVRVGETAMVQVLPPSRLGISRYRLLRRRIETLVRQINDEFARPGTPAVHYWDRPLTLDELVPLYRAADVMAVTPLRDGMNLVAKEYVASRADLGGALVLSRHAGAADELRDAVLVDPYNVDGLRRALLAAVRMDPAERAERMRSLRAAIRGRDATRWGREALAHVEGAGQGEVLAEAVPA